MLARIVIGELIILLQNIGRPSPRVKQLMDFTVISTALCFSQLLMERNALDGKNLKEIMNLLLWNNI
jgi:hypothetical protein